VVYEKAVVSCAKTIVGCGLWKSCKLFGSNKDKMYPPISIFLKTMVKQLSIFTILKAEA